MSDARELLEQADKKAAVKSGGLFSGVFGSTSLRLEEAADLYVQAANAFRMQKEYQQAGETLEKAAAIQLKTDIKDDAANTLHDAYLNYRKCNPEAAARVMERSIEMFIKRGQFRRAAQYKQDLASLYENELKKPKLAIAAYEDAGEWFSSDQAEALSNKALLKAADISALEGLYFPAIQKYEEIARSSAKNSLSKWSVKDYLLKAGLCRLATSDTVALEKAFVEYCDIDTSFSHTREFQLLQDLLEAYKNGDSDKFSIVLQEYDRFSQLDKWKTTILLHIKESIKKQDDMDDDLR